MGTGKQSLKEKKNKVTKKKAGLSATTTIIGLALIAMIGGGAYMLTRGQTNQPTSLLDSAGGAAQSGAPAGAVQPKVVDRVSVSDPVDYTAAGRVDMTNVEYTVEGDKVVLPLEEVKKNKIVKFTYKSDAITLETRNLAGKPELPVMAMISPSGKLMAGVAYCEPCRSTSFHSEGDNTLTCNLCGTKWDLETMAPRSGACSAFPPDELKAEVQDGKVFISKTDLESWKPRKET